MSPLFLQKFRDILPNLLGENWQEEDGIPTEELDADLELLIPQALREFYLALGNTELMEAHYYFWDPDELEINDGYLLFIEDEEELFTWGVKADQVDLPDPLIWRRNNAKENWVSEEGTVSEFILDYFEWLLADEDD
ncbi:hypothetical protein ODZ83_10285 [Acaricomes phytoseiuli]|uniref:hypothetical protein n=1 Tax=Acaricomes phytoseiuli TaxID=291968 RepID=UPI0022238A3B|nr:hypothetical protein [Acaricomes phytoseiuli]MCW1250557.1 hypothetical protein [Acaricomes phytoseiuli]